MPPFFSFNLLEASRRVIELSGSPGTRIFYHTHDVIILYSKPQAKKSVKPVWKKSHPNNTLTQTSKY